ncbi:hypothetical protein [Lentimicrobium sp.]|uniref:hypothetical protein n=1 Tax=Lentimicrobium sp. TaxID=2034841 RepID=UPI00345C2D77
MITPSGGVGPYEITPTQTGLAAGSYTFTVTDANSCTTTVDVTITQPAAALTATLTSQTNVLCYGEATGSVVITPAGGVSPYIITPAQTGLAAGSYTFTVTDANSCTIAVDVIITQPAAALSASAVATSSTCGNANGSVNLTVIGGTTVYDYLWSNDATTEDLTNVPAGNYNVTVTDGNGCIVTASAIVNDIGGPTASIDDQTNVLCYGNATGSATVAVTGGTSPYTFLWNDPSAQTTATASGLAAGTYTVNVTDDNGCISTTQVVIAQPAAITLTSANTVDPICNGGNGTITIIASGGTGTLSYTIGSETNTTGVFTRAAGTYDYSITDENSCGPLTGSVTIGQPAAITLSSSTAIDPEYWGENGTITIVCNGGIGTLYYTIGPETNTTGVFARPAGVWEYSVTDANNCGPLTGSVTINEAETRLLSMKLYLQGLFDTSTNTMNSPIGEGPDGNSDYITIELRNASDYSVVEYTAANAVLRTDGTINIEIPSAYNESYYLSIYHRNSINTVSAAPVSFTDGIISYDFSDDPSKAYGNNMIEVEDGIWAFYAGDVNQDGIVDIFDINLVDNDSGDFITGYVASDINGDGVVNTADIGFVYNNSSSFVTSSTP